MTEYLEDADVVYNNPWHQHTYGNVFFGKKINTDR